MRSRRRTRIARLVGCLSVCSAISGASAQAAERIYWANSGSEPGISWADVDGSGGGTLDTGDATVDKPGGVAIDSPAGKIYWANEGDDTISWGYLDGSGGGDLDTEGATVDEPLSVSIDEPARRIYWANAQGVSHASLDGGGGGNLGLSGTSAGLVNGIAVDPSLGVVYFANAPSAEAHHLSVAKLDGSGGFDLGTGSFHVEEPFGVAADNAESILYFVNSATSGIFADVGPGGPPPEIVSAAATTLTRGLAVDPIAGRVYWLNPGTSAVLVAPTFENHGGSPGAISANGARFSGPNFPALLAPPTAVAPPSVTGGASSVTCSEGEWGGDLVESQLYRAPTSLSFSWTRDGNPVAGHSSTISSAGAGSYQCQVTAGNAAGSAMQKSDVAVYTPEPERKTTQGTISLGKPKLNKKKGTASLPVTVPGAGALGLSGKGLASRRASSSAPGLVDLAIKARGKTAARLSAKGRVKVSATISFTPSTGPTQTAIETLTLLKRRHPAHG